MRWPWSKSKKGETPLDSFETLAGGGNDAGPGPFGRTLHRLGAAVHKYPILAKPVDYVGGTWRTLVDAFCETIDPLLSRAFPDLRLTAVLTGDGELELHRVTKQGVQGLGPLAALDTERRAGLAQTKWSSVELRLRPAQVLQRTLSLPSASGEFIGPIISHRLERLTPWRPDNVLYGYRIEDAKPGDAAMSVALLAVSKDALTGPLERLHEAGLKPTAIGVDEGALSSPLQLVLRQDGTQAARLDSRRTVSRVALAVFGCLAIACLGTGFLLSNAADAEHASAAKLMKGRRMLKGTGENGIGRERALLNDKASNNAMVILVDKLANAVPDDTYLKELSVAPDKVRFLGSSVNAPALVGKLEAAGLLNVRFTSAITRGKDQRDSFEITADRTAATDKADR